MKLAILGSGTTIPHPERGASGYACIADDGSVLLLECGPGSTRRWPAHGIELGRVAGIVCTHHHLDHVSDLGAVLFLRNVVEPPPTTPMTLVGPVGHRALVEGLVELHGAMVADRAGLLEVVELGHEDRFSLGSFTVEARHVQHSEGAIGLRVRADGRVLAFSGDSGPCDGLVDLFRGVDLVLAECSYPASRESSHHLNTTTAAEMASAAGIGRLVLTHFYPACDAVDVEGEVRAGGYEGELSLAVDGAAYDV